jgi:hypothetical protein
LRCLAAVGSKKAANGMRLADMGAGEAKSSRRTRTLTEAGYSAGKGKRGSRRLGVMGMPGDSLKSTLTAFRIILIENIQVRVGLKEI